MERPFQCDRADPFYAIVTDGEDAHPKSIDGTGDLDAMPLWQVKGKTSIPRNAGELAAALNFILKQCHEILIVDREFIPSGGTGNKWLKPIASIAATLASQSRVTRFELHSLDKPTAPWPKGKFTDDCSHHLPRIIPKALSLSANLWSQKPAGIQFHERLIITDVGGVLFGPRHR